MSRRFSRTSRRTRNSNSWFRERPFTRITRGRLSEFGTRRRGRTMKLGSEGRRMGHRRFAWKRPREGSRSLCRPSRPLRCSLEYDRVPGGESRHGLRHADIEQRGCDVPDRPVRSSEAPAHGRWLRNLPDWGCARVRKAFSEQYSSGRDHAVDQRWKVMDPDWSDLPTVLPG